jgi:hypothetical protein
MTTSDEIHALQDLQFIVTGFCGAPNSPTNAAFFFGVSP